MLHKCVAQGCKRIENVLVHELEHFEFLGSHGKMSNYVEFIGATYEVTRNRRLSKRKHEGIKVIKEAKSTSALCSGEVPCLMCDKKYTKIMDVVKVNIFFIAHFLFYSKLSNCLN